MWYVKIYTTCVDLTQNVLNTFLIAMMETIKQHVETSVMETAEFSCVLTNPYFKTVLPFHIICDKTFRTHTKCYNCQLNFKTVRTQLQEAECR